MKPTVNVVYNYLRAVNNLDVDTNNSFLSDAHASGVGTIRVRNINQFAASQAVQIGKTGEETSEIVMTGTAAVSGTSLVLTGTTRFDHATDTPVYPIKYDQIVFERSTDGTLGTATPMTGGTISIMPDGSYTQFEDTSGSSGYAYKAYYKNSVTAGTSYESDFATQAGYSFYSKNKIRERIKNKLFSVGYIRDDQVIEDWMNEWLEKMTNVAIDVNKDYAIGTTSVAFSGTAELGTITVTDFKDVRRVFMTSNGTDYIKATRMSLIDYYPDQTFTDTNPYFYFQGDNVIGRKPATASGTANIVYYKLNPILVNDTDELPVVMRGYTKTFVDYSLSQAFFLDEKDPKGKLYLDSANQDIERFRAEITPRSKTGPQTVTITDATSADEYDNF